MAPQTKPVKAMSSRLMNMKFMQRASGGSPASSAASPDQRPAKRPRFQESPSAAKSGVRAESPKLEDSAAAFLERQAELAGDTKWVLDIPEPIEQPTSRAAASSFGWNEIGQSDDSSSDGKDDDEEKALRALTAGRLSYNGANPEVEAIHKRYDKVKARRRDKDDGQLSDDSGGSRAGTANGRSRATNHDVDLSALTSISNAGAGPSASAQKSFSGGIICHKCGRKGHTMSRCPDRVGGPGGGGRLGNAHGKRKYRS